MTARALAVFIASSLLTACGGPPNLRSQDVISIPYVESVSLPDTVVEGQTVEVTIMVSVNANPGLLSSSYTRKSYGYPRSFIQGIETGRYRDGDFLPIAIETVESQLPSDENLTQGLWIFDVVFDHPGENYIYITSVPTRSIGGMEFNITRDVLDYDYPPESDLVEYREIVVNVLPAE